MDSMSPLVATFAADPVALSVVRDDAAPETGARMVTGRVVPFGVEADRGFFRAIFSADSLRLPEDLGRVKLLTEHDPERPVGYGTAAEFHDDGLYMTFAVPPDHARAAGYLADLDANLRDGFSVGIRMDQSTRDAISEALFNGPPPDPILMAGEVSEVSGVSLPQFPDARAAQFAVPQLIRFNEGLTVMPAPTLTAPAPEPVPAPAPDPRPNDPAPAALTMAQFAVELAPFMHAAAPAHPLAQFSTLADYADAVWSGRIESFALVDQVTGANPGVVPPGWVSEVAGIVDLGRPAITALGGPKALPPSGMELDWPVFAGNIGQLVQEQLTQKSDIASVLVSLTKGSSPVRSFAGGSDVSYQLIRRSSPSYMDAYLRIMSAGYAACTENAFEDALAAGATPLVHATTDGAAIRAALFAASSAVFRATGKPATVAIVATDVFAAWGGLPDLYPSAYGTNNISGTAQASTLAINVSGLPVVEGPYLAPGTILVTNDLAAAWHEDGPFTITAEDVSKLGQNVAVWGMGATRISSPAGLIRITASAE